MTPGVNAANRVILFVLGLLLLLLAAAGLLIGFAPNIPGVSLPEPGARVVPQQVLDYTASSAWFWWVVAAGCVLVALLAFRWLLAQLTTNRLSEIDLTNNDRDGVTVLHSGAVTRAVEAETATYAGVDGASAHLKEHPHPGLVLTVDVAEYADLGAVRTQVEQGVVQQIRRVVDDPHLPIDIRLRPTDTRRRDT